MLSYIPTQSAEKAKKRKKEKLKIQGCVKCPLSKNFEHTPVYSRNLLVPYKTIRQNSEEKIVVILIPRPYTDEELLPYKARNMLGTWTAQLLPDAHKIYMFPVIQCPHIKDPTKNMVGCCEEYLRKELVEANPDVIICLGKAASLPFKLDGKATEIMGRIYNVAPIKSGDKQSKSCKLIVTHSPDKFTDDRKTIGAVESAFNQANRILIGGNIETPDNYYLIESPEEFEHFVNEHLTSPKLSKLVHAFDIETNGRAIHPASDFDLAHPPKLRCISFSWGAGFAVCVPTENDELSYLPILKRFMESSIKFIGHNVSFDFFFLKLVNNIATKNIVGDTMNMAYLLGFGGFAGLKPLAAQLTNLGGYETDMKSTPDEVDEDGNIVKTKWELADMETMAPYNCADSDATLQIYTQFIEKIKEKNMLPAHWIMTKAIFHLGEMEHMGLHVNSDWVNSTKEYMSVLLEKYKKELKSLCNGHEYDWNSPQEMAHVLYDLFNYDIPDTGKQNNKKGNDEDNASLPTGDVALSIINTPFTQALRKYRKCFKLLSTYFNGYLGCIGLDGNLRSRYNLTGTATGRLSSSGIGDAKINMQNLPSSWAPTDPGYEDMHDYKVKKAFVPRHPGWVMVNVDQSQLELRVAGQLAKEMLIAESYINGIDLHSRNAKVSFLLQTPDKEFKEALIKEGFKPGTKEFDIELLKKQCKYVKNNHPDRRQAAKKISFGVLYGMGPKGLYYTLENDARDNGVPMQFTEADCASMINNFNKGYPTLTRWQNLQVTFAKKNGYVVSPFGRRRYLNQINNNDDFKEKSQDERRAKNTLVQGFGSDLMQCGIINLYAKMDHTRAYLVCTVHDSLVAEVAPDYVDDFIALAKECMEHPKIGNIEVPQTKIVPLLLEAEVGPSYGELEPYTYPFNKNKE